ncbi:ribosomal protein L24E [Colletotrichum higginsianum]|nr:ribosomal protein L24E [Colletotrichum higginsianum]
MQHAQHPQNGAALNTPTGSTPGGVNPNAAPGPIPATTPLVVRQDQNGVQWIAFEYSRDRVKMEYTIRCDVESVNTDELSAEFKTENCVYPRACCPKDQYRGNRQVYETECNTVGWALAQLNPPLRGKRGLIQRAVDSWRNSNQDPRLRSRRVRRMAKMNTRKSVQGGPHPGAHMGGPSPPGMPQGPGGMGPAGASTKMPGMNMGHMSHANAPGGGDEVGMFHQM